MKKTLFIIGWLILIGCNQTTSNNQYPKTESPKESTEINSPPRNSNKSPSEYKDILNEREKELKLAAEEKKTVADNYYEIGYKFYLESKYTQAKENFRKTLELVPEHKKAKQYLEEIIGLEGGFVPGDLGTEVRSRINEITAVIQQLTLEVQNHLNSGIRYYDAGDYDQAEEEFKWVIQTVKWAPYPIELAPYQKQAEGYLQNTLQKKKEKELQQKRVRDIETRKLMEKEEEKRREEFVKNIQTLFRQVNESFKIGNFNETIRLCNKILDKDPNNQLALRLKDIAFQAQRDQRKKENTKLLGEEWKKTLEEYQLELIPMAGTVSFPDKETWQKIDNRGPRKLNKEKVVSSIDKEAALILNRRVSFPFREGATLQQIIEYIKGQLSETGINIITAEGVDPATITISYGAAIPTPIKSAFKEMFKQPALDYMIKDGIVIIAPRQRVLEAQLETRAYDVLDLVIEIPNFTAPDIGLFTAPPPAQTPPPAPRITGDDLARLIRENLGKAENGFVEGTSCDFQQPSLIIKHLPSVHKEVEQLLSGLRAAMDLVVTINARFLEVHENFLEDIGVDMGQLSTLGDGTAAPNLPDSLQQTAVMGGSGFTALSPGLYKQSYQNGTQNVRSSVSARVEQIITADTLLGRFSTLVFSRPVSPTMSYTRLPASLRQAQLQFIVRAVEKEERGKILYSPELTVYNGQRGFINVADVFAYMRNYVVTMVQPGQVLPDPQPAFLSVGTILEVRPSVSADLRYITMELKPQMVSPIAPYRIPNLRTRRVQFTNPLASGSNPPISLMGSVVYEMCDIEYQSVQTNVVIPDGGTVIIGGYHTGQEMDYESGVPILSKIPIIGALFSEKVKGGQRRVLLIIIKAKITSMSQEEKERF